MAFHKPDKMLNIALEAGVSKTNLSLSSILMLGFLGGAVFPVGFIYFSSYPQKQKEQLKKAS
jgi:formate/nitrite transporter FocA (FNT family)